MARHGRLVGLVSVRADYATAVCDAAGAVDPEPRGGVSLQLRNDMLGHRVRVTEICPGRVETEIFGRNLGGSPGDLKRAWAEFYEHYESVTTADSAGAARFALEAPEHVNVGMIEIMPTLQVPGGLTFNQSR